MDPASVKSSDDGKNPLCRRDRGHLYRSLMGCGGVKFQLRAWEKKLMGFS